MKKCTFVFVFVLIAAFQYASGMDIVPGTATGSIKLDGKEYPIKFSYALGIGDQYWLLLTDVSIPAMTFDNPRQVRSLGVDGKTHGLLMTLDSKGVPDPIMILQVVEVTNHPDWHKLEFSKLSKELLEVTTKTTSAQEGDNKTYEYNISFKTPVNVVKR